MCDPVTSFNGRVITMIEQKLQLLDKLKEKKYSLLVHSVRQRILDVLNSDKFSTHIHRYLKCNLVLMETSPHLDALDRLAISTNEAYVRVRRVNDAVDTLFYVNRSTKKMDEIVLTPDKLVSFDTKLNPIGQEKTLSEDQLKNILSITGHMRLNREGEPFSDFSHEPDQISQVKKLINVFYYTELALKDAETVDFRGSNITKAMTKLMDLKTLYANTIHYIYKAGHLATHLDIDFIQMFNQELSLLAPVFQLFKTYAEHYREETNGLLAQMDLYDVLHKLGLVSGIAVDQMNPKAGEPDYEFLTKFGAASAYYLEQLTLKVENFSSLDVAEREPQINRQKLDELQAHALQIINALEGRHANGLFLPLEALHYIHLLRHTLALSMSIFEQTGHLHASTQEKVREQLTELKYKQLPLLFGFTDKVEEQVMLKPGTLSNPLMAQVSRIYQALITYTAKFVDFSTVGHALVVLEDPLFVAKRLQIAYERLTDHNSALLLIDEARVVSNKFFKMLQKPAYLHRRLINLEAHTKGILTTHYKSLQAYVAVLDQGLNTAIIASLTGTSGYMDGPLTSPVRRILQRHSDRDIVSDILRLQARLEALFLKATTSRQFHVALNRDLIDSVAENVEKLVLRKQDPTHNPFNIDEAIVLGRAVTEMPQLIFEVIAENNRLMNPEHLNREQVLSLYQFYQVESFKLEAAFKAYQVFLDILQAGNALAEKKKLRNLYGVFQPYLAHANTAIDLVVLDGALLAALSSDSLVLPVVMPLMPARREILFNKKQRQLGERRQVFAHLLKAYTASDLRMAPLVLDRCHARAYHVIKHREFSKAVADFSASLSELMHLFNDSVRAQLRKQAEGLPFPELVDLNETLAQSGQALGLKRLFNCLYHVEAILENLESLHEHSLESTFAYTILQVGDHLLQVVLLIQAIAGNPYFSLMINDARHKLDNVSHVAQALQGLYGPAPTAVPVKGIVKAHTPIFYALNAMEIIPPFITAQRANAHLSPEVAHLLHQLAEKKAANIVRILGKSSSYFKLFFEIPTMYGLFGDLKIKLVTMTTMLHGVVVNNLRLINEELFTKILLEVDEWEDNLGLIPGTLTHVLTEMFDAFYPGLLEPLGLNSYEYISSVTSMIPLGQRYDATLQRAANAGVEQNKIQIKQAILQRLLHYIQNYHEEAVDYSGFLYTRRAIVIDVFKQALPILREENVLLGPDILPGPASDRRLDAWLNAGIEHGPELNNIKALTRACLSRFQGLHASHQLILDTANEKMAYLTGLVMKQPAVKLKRIEVYTTSVFRKKLKETLVAHQVGLKHIELAKEYHDELKKWLRSFEAEMVGVAQHANDIDQTMGEMLHEKIQQFNLDHYKTYADFDRVITAIGRWQRYVSQPHPVFENVRTLEQKNILAKRLQELARRKAVVSPAPELTVSVRLAAIKEHMTLHKVVCMTTMCNACYHPAFTWLWLAQSIATFLEWIGIYTPERKKCYDQLIQSMEPTTSNTLPARHAFFPAWPKRAYDLPTVVVVEQQAVNQPVLA